MLELNLCISRISSFHYFRFLFRFLQYFKGRGFITGDVVNFEKETGLYSIVFEDGDCDEYTEKEVEKIITNAASSSGADTPKKQKKRMSSSSKAKSPRSVGKNYALHYQKYKIGTVVEKVGCLKCVSLFLLQLVFPF